jgi:excinuclease UvrABC helicase subunit UvrB
MYWRMHQFQKSRIVLLEEFQKLVSESLSREPEFITHDIRRYNRKLKAMRRAIQEWMGELTVMEKLKKQSGEYLEEQRKKTEEYYASDPCNRDQ